MPHTLDTRRHDLDALRACAMLLGIVLHAAIAYAGFNWAVVDPSHNQCFAWLFYGVHGFRMQLFFLISGYFTCMLYQKRGLKELLLHRLKRILIPLLIFAPLTSPLINYILTQAYQKQGTAELFASFHSGNILADFNFHHLWFLYFLCFFVLAFSLITICPKPNFPKRFLTYPSNLFYIVPITLVIQSFLTRSYPTFGPESSLGLIPKLPVLLYYATFFFFGCLLFLHPKTPVGLRWKLLTVTALLFLFPLGMWTEWWSYYNAPNLQILSDILQVLFTWSMVFACIGFFQIYCSHPSKVMRYLSDASYWLYLAHLPLVFAIQLLIQNWQITCFLKFPIVILATLAPLLLAYHFVVRKKPLGKLLNGK
ncbi:acyltransferase family protein [Rubritalea tangerina]|uniref:Acyltransferase family protein n=1 Tax=Rubritalea tangerina TaxID=430798 RepID=A0ABW4ZAN8_9BACT